MDEPVPISLPPIVGQVVEIYPKGKTSTVKIALKVCHIEIPLHLLDDPHLGDEVLLNLGVEIQRLRTIHTNGVSRNPSWEINDDEQ